MGRASLSLAMRGMQIRATMRAPAHLSGSHSWDRGHRVLGDMGKACHFRATLAGGQTILENCLAASHKVQHSPKCLTWVFIHLREMKIYVDTAPRTKRLKLFRSYSQKLATTPMSISMRMEWRVRRTLTRRGEGGRLIRHNAQDESHERYVE